jgi:hypothetical protein
MLASNSGNFQPSCFPNDKHGRERWLACCLKQLDAGKIEDIATTCELQPANPELAKVVSKEAETPKLGGGAGVSPRRKS